MEELFLSRRQFVKLGAFGLLSASCARTLAPAFAFGQWVNDEHSALNATRVSRVIKPTTQAQLLALVNTAVKERKSFSTCGARHSAGGQQFLQDQMLVDCTAFNSVIAYDQDKGLLTVEPGARWSDLLHWLHGDYINGQGKPGRWTIRQRPTGTDQLTIGGTLSSNAHGQGLKFKPLIDDVRSLQLIDSSGKLVIASRTENTELFALAVGGYGLFGLITSITFQLVPTKKYRCSTEIVTVDQIPLWHEHALAEGCQYGSVQICIDEKSKDFLQSGVGSRYLPLDDDTKCSVRSKILPKQWTTLVATAHKNKAMAWKQFSALQMSANGAIDWGYRWHSSPYVAGYHHVIDKLENKPTDSSEVLTELYVPLASLSQFMSNVAADCRANQTNILYSTVRFVERDTESFLAWAKQSYACVIFNLHVDHTAHDIASGAVALRRLINRAVAYGGSYYLTYHRFASKDEVLACYPQFPQMLSAKLRLDPNEVFQSDWYRHYKAMLA